VARGKQVPIPLRGALGLWGSGPGLSKRTEEADGKRSRLVRAVKCAACRSPYPATSPRRQTSSSREVEPRSPRRRSDNMSQSTVRKRSIVIAGHKTSVSLEDGFWEALTEIAAARNTRVSELVAAIKRGREGSNVSSAIRLFVLDTFRRRVEGNTGDLRQRAVLVVDDDPLALRLAADMLAGFGCDVRTANDGTQALEKIERDPRIEVLIADVEMPGLPGNQVAEQAKRIRPGLQIILMSGHEADPKGLPLIRKPFLETDLKRLMSQAGLCH
jgi:predicted DNA-binding ribbon-helix-helix protein